MAFSPITRSRAATQNQFRDVFIARLVPVSQSVDQETKSKRVLAAARIIKVIAGKRRTPLSQHSYQCAGGEVILNLIDWKRRKAMAGAYSLADQAGRVEGELA